MSGRLFLSTSLIIQLGSMACFFQASVAFFYPRSLEVMSHYCLVCAWWQHQDQVLCSCLHGVAEADASPRPSLRHTPYCSHAFLPPDALYKILLDAPQDFTGGAISSSSFPPADFLPVVIISSLSKCHHALEGNMCG